MRDRTKAKPSASPSHDMAETVRDMVKHYQETGAYRPEDVRTVLGDPLGGVVFEARPDAEAEYRRRS
jgi:hypothetical protein